MPEVQAVYANKRLFDTLQKSERGTSIDLADMLRRVLESQSNSDTKAVLKELYQIPKDLESYRVRSDIAARYLYLFRQYVLAQIAKRLISLPPAEQGDMMYECLSEQSLAVTTSKKKTESKIQSKTESEESLRGRSRYIPSNLPEMRDACENPNDFFMQWTQDRLQDDVLAMNPMDLLRTVVASKQVLVVTRDQAKSLPEATKHALVQLLTDDLNQFSINSTLGKGMQAMEDAQHVYDLPPLKDAMGRAVR